jgi:hypothetical protein
MKRLSLFVLVACGRPLVPGGEPHPPDVVMPAVQAAPWARAAGADVYTTVDGVAAEPDGTVVVTGNFQGAAVFGRGEPNETTLHSSNAGGTFSGNCDIFIASYASDGALQWVRHPSGTLRPDQITGRNSGIGIAVTKSSDLLVTGELDGIITFGKGEPNETTLASVGGIDGFLARYRVDGTLVWVKRFGGSQQDTRSLRLAEAPDESLYVAGQFEGDVTFDGVALSGQGHAGEEPNAFLARYSRDGALDWVRAVQGKGSHGWGVAAAPDGSAVLVGDFFDTADLGAVQVSSGNRFMPMAFIAKYAADGTARWASAASTSSFDAESVAFAAGAAADGSVFVGGYFNSTVDLAGASLSAAGYATLWLAGFDADGHARFVRSDGGNGGNFTNALAVLPSGDVLLAGFAEVEPSVDFGTLSLSLYGGARGHDGFVARYHADGSFVWASHVGGDGTTHATAVAATADGFLLGGLFSGAATFSGTTALTADSGATDGFVAHYVLDGATAKEP